MTELRERVVALADALKGAFYERDRMVEGLIVALLSRQHVLLLGSPGTAKSALADATCAAIEGADFFDILMTRFTVPEEVFGPVSLSGLKQDKFRRVTDGYMPTAHICFLDEIFKANSAILNATLKAINERRFKNNGTMVNIPLETVVGASNELPEGGPTGELAALYDRFLIRYWVEPLKSDTAFVDLLADEDSDGNDTSAEPSIPDSCRLTLAELKSAQDAVTKVKMTRDAAEKMAQLRRELAGKGVSPSDRRYKAAAKALRADAWLSGDAEVTEDHFAILSDCLWDDPEQRRDVALVVQQFCGQQVGEALRIHDSLVDLINELPTDKDERANQITNVSREGKRAEEGLDKLAAEATSESNKLAIGKLRGQVVEALRPLRREARAALGI